MVCTVRDKIVCCKIKKLDGISICAIDSVRVGDDFPIRRNNTKFYYLFNDIERSNILKCKTLCAKYKPIIFRQI